MFSSESLNVSKHVIVLHDRLFCQYDNTHKQQVEICRAFTQLQELEQCVMTRLPPDSNNPFQRPATRTSRLLVVELGVVLKVVFPIIGSSKLMSLGSSRNSGAFLSPTMIPLHGQVRFRLTSAPLLKSLR